MSPLQIFVMFRLVCDAARPYDQQDTRLGLVLLTCFTAVLFYIVSTSDDDSFSSDQIYILDHT